MVFGQEIKTYLNTNFHNSLSPQTSGDKNDVVENGKETTKYELLTPVVDTLDTYFNLEELHAKVLDITNYLLNLEKKCLDRNYTTKAMKSYVFLSIGGCMNDVIDLSGFLEISHQHETTNTARNRFKREKNQIKKKIKKKLLKIKSRS